MKEAATPLASSLAIVTASQGSPWYWARKGRGESADADKNRSEKEAHCV